MSRIQAQKIAERFRERLEEEKYPFSAVYLFGSHATGKAREESDIDIAVLSKKLEKNWNENEELLWKIGVEVDSRIEPHGFSPKDFEENWIPMVSEIKKTGIKIG